MSDPKPTTAERLRRMIKDDDSDEELWQTIKEKMETGNEELIKEGVTVFFDNYRKISFENDDYILTLFDETDNVEVRRHIAKEYVNCDAKLPVVWDYNFLIKLQLIDDEVIQEITITKQDEYFKMIKEMTDSFTNIKLPSLNLPVINFNALGNFNDALNNIRAINKNIANHFDAYYKPEPLFKIEETKQEKHSLIKKIESYRAGEDEWKKYEDVCEEVLEYLFYPQLGTPISQARTENGIHIRDYILHIPYDASGYWNYIRDKFDSIGLVIEIKNKIVLEPNDLVITSKYLNEKRCGRFAILITRTNIKENVWYEVKRLWKEDDKMIIVLNENELKKMIELKQDNTDPERYLDQRLFKFRSELE